MNTTNYIRIFRGDDSDALGYQTIVGTIKTDLDLTGCKAVFRFLGFYAEFDPISEDKKLTIVIPAQASRGFPPGVGYASLKVLDALGKIRTFTNRIPVIVDTMTPSCGCGEFEVSFSPFPELEPLKIFVGPNADDFDQYTGFISKIIDRASLVKYGLVMLSDAMGEDGGNSGKAASPAAVKAAYDAIIATLTDNYYNAEQTEEAIDRVAAYYITYTAAGAAFPTYAALANATTVYSGGKVRVPTRNDYCVVLADETHQGAEYRYIYAVADGETTGSWQPQFPVEGVMTVDQTVQKNSQNPVSGGGVWSMLWGALQNIPEGLSSVYAWVLNRLGLKRDYTDLSYDMTETVEVPALHATMTSQQSEQVIVEYDLLCTEEVPDPPQIGHVYTWREDGAAFYVTQGVSALQTTWTLYSYNGDVLGGVTTQNATQGFYPDVEFRPSNAIITIHKTTAQKTVTVEDDIALESKVYSRAQVDGLLAGKVPTTRKVNGKALSADVTLTGANIAVSGSDPTKIDAALAGKVSKSGDTMTGMLTAPSLTVGDRATGSSVGNGSVAEGLGTEASGAFAHAEGLNTKATNRSSHSEGVATNATGSQSHAEGFHTSATNPNEHAEGSYNASHTSNNESSATRHSIGIGTSDNNRKNAVETMGDGKTFIYGIGGYDGTNPTATGTKDLATAVNGKANRAPNPTAGNLAALDANGNPVDSGIKPSDKLDSTSAAPAFSSDSSVSYPVGSRVTYNGKLYVCTTATTGGTWVAASWAEDTMTDPDAVLDITSQNQLRVVAKDGTLLWAQGYALASTSSATLACDACNNFTFADGATSQAFALPTAPSGKVGDFGLDIDNSANTSAATMTLTGLDTTFSVVVPEGESLTDMLAIAAGELARFYITLSSFRVNNLPTWHIMKQIVENGGATV